MWKFQNKGEKIQGKYISNYYPVFYINYSYKP